MPAERSTRNTMAFIALMDEVFLEPWPNVLHVRNAPSPGATASLAIADHVVELAAATTPAENRLF